MTALYIIGGILLFFFLLLIIPVSVFFEYDDDFVLKIRYGGVKILDLKWIKKLVSYITEKSKKPKKEKPKKKKKKQEKEPKKEKEKSENFILKYFKEKGIIESVRFCLAVLYAALVRIVRVLKHIRIKKLFLDITVSSDDAANTAIVYGSLCAVLCPLVNLLERRTKIGVKQVNVRTDFDKLSPIIKTSVFLKTELIFAVIAAISMLFEFLKIKKESDKNERKQLG